MPVFDIYDNQVPRRVIIDAVRITIGRTADNQVIIHERLASRQHCEVRLEQLARVELSDTPVSGSEYVLRDLHSRNGTYVNQHKVREPTALQDGDEITIGNSALRFWSSPDTVDPASPTLPIIVKEDSGTE